MHRALGIATVALAAAWAPFGQSGAVAEGGLLLRGNSGEPGTLDPHLAHSTAELIIVNDLFTGLLSQDSRGRAIPGAAASHSVSGDGLTWTFSLRGDLKWSDGKPIGSEDFLYSFRRSLDPDTASPRASLLFPIRNARAVNAGKAPPEQLGVSAPDPLTVKFELESPAPYFDRILLTSPALPVPRHLVETYGRKWARPPHAAGNGAFKLAAWTPRVHVEVRKNPLFHDHETVRLGGVRYLPTEDLSTQLKRFRAGELDLGLNFPPSQTAWVKKNLGDSVRIFPILGTYYYPFNLSAPKFGDRRTRRALTMAIDREAIAAKLLGSGERPAYSFVPPGFEDYPAPAPPDYAALSMRERRAEARRLLAEAGFGASRPLELELRYNMTEEHQAIAVAVAAMWRAIGVEARLLSTETRTHFRDLAMGEFDIGRAAMFATYNDPRAFLEVFSSDNRAGNYAGYANPEFDRMLEEANGIFEPRSRGERLQRAEALALSDYPAIPIYHYVSKRLVSPRVKGWRDNPVGAHLSRYLWLENEE